MEEDITQFMSPLGQIAQTTRGQQLFVTIKFIRKENSLFYPGAAVAVLALTADSVRKFKLFLQLEHS